MLLRWHGRAVGRALALVGLALAASCEHTPCDPGYVLRKGLCDVAQIDAAALPDAAAVSPSSDAGGSSEGKYAHYGDECGTVADCERPTDYCGKAPGQAKGTCTHTGCKADPSVCPPSGWRCLDLSAFDPALPSICEKQ